VLLLYEFQGAHQCVRVKTQLTIVGLVGYVTLAITYTVEQMRQMIVDDMHELQTNVEKAAPP
jgi:hypothetical protein